MVTGATLWEHSHMSHLKAVTGFEGPKFETEVFQITPQGEIVTTRVRGNSVNTARPCGAYPIGPSVKPGNQ